MVDRICKICGKEFKVFPYTIKLGYGNFCSDVCKGKSFKGRHQRPSYGHRGKKHSLKTKKLISKNRKGKFTGEKNNRWNGGIGSYRKYINILKCEDCGSTKKLYVHHKDRNRHNNLVTNLKVLCPKCHCKEHNHFNRWKTIKK